VKRGLHVDAGMNAETRSAPHRPTTGCQHLLRARARIIGRMMKAISKKVEEKKTPRKEDGEVLMKSGSPRRRGQGEVNKCSSTRRRRRRGKQHREAGRADQDETSQWW